MLTRYLRKVVLLAIAVAVLACLAVPAETARANPWINITPESYDFGSIGVEDELTQTFTIENTGTSDLELGRLTQSGPNTSAFVFGENTCNGETLAPAATCTFTIAFHPNTPGLKQASVDVPHNVIQKGISFPVMLSGTGARTTRTVEPASIDFGSVEPGTISSTRPITITNTGSYNLKVNSATLSGVDADAFQLTNDSCTGQAVAPLGTCIIDITFNPTAEGAFAAQVEVDDEGERSPQIIMLSGTGAVSTIPRIAVDTLSIDFDSLMVSDISAHVVAITNTSGMDITLSSLGVGGTGAGEFSVTNDTCSQETIVPDGTCSFAVVFNPMTEGAHTAEIVIEADGLESPYTIHLRGTGRPPADSSPEPTLEGESENTASGATACAALGMAIPFAAAAVIQQRKRRAAG